MRRAPSARSAHRDARRDPDLLGDREELAVGREQRRTRKELAAVLAERPGSDGTRLAPLGDPLDTSGHTAEHDVPSPLRPDRERPGAVDGRPHELWSGLVEGDRRRVQRLSAGDEAHPDGEAISLFA